MRETRTIPVWDHRALRSILGTVRTRGLVFGGHRCRCERIGFKDFDAGRCIGGGGYHDRGGWLRFGTRNYPDARGVGRETQCRGTCGSNTANTCSSNAAGPCGLDSDVSCGLSADQGFSGGFA